MYTWYIHPMSMCVSSFNFIGLTVPEKSATKIFNVWKLERKKTEEIKGQISSSILIPVYMIHLPTVHVYTKFQPSWEECDEKIQYLKIGEKEKWRNNGTNKQQQPDSGIHNTSAHCPHVYQKLIFQDTTFWWLTDVRYRRFINHEKF